MTEMELRERLERLERDNRRMKKLGVAALVLAAALGVMAATRPVPQGTHAKPDLLAGATRIHRKLVAHEFDVVDNSGNVRIRLYATPFNASVEVLDAQGNSAAAMTVYRGFSSIAAGKDGDDVALLSSVAQVGASVGVGYVPDWHAAVVGKSGKALLDAMKSYLTGQESSPSVNMSVSPSRGANITLQDARGFSMDLGSTGTMTPATGATQQTSAASIIMFGNDKKHHAIWKAP